MRRPAALGIDVGRRLTKIVLLSDRAERELLVPTKAGGLRPALDRIAGEVPAGVDRTRVVIAMPAGPGRPEDLTHDSEVRTAASQAFRTEDVEQVHVAVCTAACAADGPDGGENLRLVCDVGAGSVSVAVCAGGAAGLRLVDTEVREAGTATILEDVLGIPVPEQVQRFRRAEQVLGRAATHPRYLSTPVFFPDGPQSAGITAATLVDALEPIASTVRRQIVNLETLLHEHLSDAILIMAGGYGGLPSIRAAATAALSGNPDQAVRKPGIGAAARGAALIASGRVSVERTFPHTIRLRLRRLRSGLLQSVDIALTEAGQPAPRMVEHLGEPLTVGVDEDDQGDPLMLQVQDEDSRIWIDLRTPAAVRPPPGTYRLGLQPGRSPLGVLVLHPVKDGPAVVIPLSLPDPGSSAPTGSSGNQRFPANGDTC